MLLFFLSLIPYYLRVAETKALGHSVQKAGVVNGGRDAQVGKHDPHDGKEGSFGNSCSRVLGTKVEPLVEREEGRLRVCSVPGHPPYPEIMVLVSTPVAEEKVENIPNKLFSGPHHNGTL